MINNFAACLTETLKWEGGFADNPRDPGGITMRGVTARTYEAFTGKTVSRVQMASLTEADVAPIYLAKYWLVAQCGRLPAGVDLSVFDEAVNSGPARALAQLHTALRPDAQQTIIAIANGRLAFLRALRTWRYFGTGWARRVANVEAVSLRMAGSGLAPSIAQHEIKTKASKILGHAAATTAAVVVSAGTLVHQARVLQGIGLPMLVAIVVGTVLAIVAVLLYLHARAHATTAKVLAGS